MQRVFWIIVVLAATASIVAAGDVRPKELLGWRAFVENDLLARDGDRYYTNGLKLELWYAGPDPKTLARGLHGRMAARWCARRAERAQEPECIADLGFGLGQTFYTPTFIMQPEPQPLDRPWAGYLFMSTAVTVATESRQHFLEGQLGVIGPSAGAKFVQKNWHELIDDPDEPLGWDNQIPDQPAIQLLYDHRRRWGGDHLDAIASLGAGVGTVQLYAVGGVTLRAGTMLRGFGKFRIEPTVPAVPAAAPDGPAAPPALAKREPSGFHGFLTVQRRWIPFNTFLRGGTFHRIETEIEPKKSTWDVSLGVAVPLSKSRRCSLGYEVIRRSSEFEPTGEAHRWGSVVLGCLARGR